MTEVPAAYTKTGAKYQLAEQVWYWNFIKLWREMAAQGKLGKNFYAEGEYLHHELRRDCFKHKKPDS